MKVVLTNLANKLFQENRFKLNDSARHYGIENINSYDLGDIKDSSFYAANKKILDQPKGIGYWLWKPYIILETMKNLSDGDIVIYSDCGIEFVGSPEPVINICQRQQPILLFANGDFKNLMWTKRDCFVLMDCDNESYWNGQHCDAAFSLFRKSEESIHFLNNWLRYGCDERIITDLPNQCGKENLPGFIEHRWDQSVLSLLAQLHRLTLFRMPTQFGNHYKSLPWRVKNEFNCVNQLRQKPVKYYANKPNDNSPYGQFLNHHRTKKDSGGDKNDNSNIASRIKQMTLPFLRRLSK